MRILFVTQWFEPEPAFKGVAFAKALAERGHAVEVATAFPNYPGGKLYPGYRIRPYRRDAVEGITVHRLAIWPSHDRSALGRVANYLSFFLTTLVFGLVRGGRYDAIYVYHPPITPALAAALFAKVHRKPLLVEIQDLWPDSVGASGMVGERTAGILGAICNFVYRRATMIVPQSSKMLEAIAARGVPVIKLRRIYNWATYQPAPAGAAPAGAASLADAFAGRFNIVYGGNLGQAQALGSILEAVARARETHSSLHLHLFGDGIERGDLERQAAALGDGVVTFHGPVARAAMDRVFDRADLLIVQLKDDPLYDITIPSKVQHYLACGRPIVAGLRGEAADLLDRSGAAIVCPPQHIAAIAEAIRHVASMSAEARAAMGAHGRRYYVENLGFDRAIDETIAVLDEAVAKHSGRPPAPCPRNEA